MILRYWAIGSREQFFLREGKRVSPMTSGFPLHKAGILKDIYCVTGIART